jgi:hypothetical protein
MTDDDMEVVRGSGNVFRDFGYADADVRQAKALLAAQIIEVLDAEELSTRQAEAKTGVAQRVCPHPQRQSRALHDRPSGDDPRALRPGGTNVAAVPSCRTGQQKIKAGHWRILEKTIRDLAGGEAQRVASDEETAARGQAWLRASTPLVCINRVCDIMSS